MPSFCDVPYLVAVGPQNSQSPSVCLSAKKHGVIYREDVEMILAGHGLLKIHNEARPFQINLMSMFYSVRLFDQFPS